MRGREGNNGNQTRKSECVEMQLYIYIFGSSKRLFYFLKPILNLKLIKSAIKNDF